MLMVKGDFYNRD